jgi:hypothetical protein
MTIIGVCFAMHRTTQKWLLLIKCRWCYFKIFCGCKWHRASAVIAVGAYSYTIADRSHGYYWQDCSSKTISNNVYVECECRTPHRPIECITQPHRRLYVQAPPLLLLLKYALFGDAVVSAVVICCYTQASSVNKGRSIATAIQSTQPKDSLKHVHMYIY